MNAQFCQQQATYSARPTNNPYPQGVPDVAMGVHPMAPPTYNQATGTAESFKAPFPPSGVDVNNAMGQGQPYVPQIQTMTCGLQLGPSSCQVKCPSCNKNVLTRTEQSPNTMAHICCLALFFTGIGFFCSCLPYCMDSLQVTRHYCPNCSAYLGRYQP